MENLRKILEEYSKDKRLLDRYWKIVMMAKTRKYLVGDNHHILPKSLFPDYRNDKENVVRIPRKLHFTLHIILCKVLPGKEMRYALNRMMNSKKYGRICSGKMFERIREEFSDLRKIEWTGERNPIHKLTAEGRNPFQKEDHPAKVASREGKHWWLGNTNPSVAASAIGMNPSQIAAREGTHWSHKLALEGKHNQQIVAKMGTHRFSGVKPWNAFRTNENSVQHWKNAREVYQLWQQNKETKYVAFTKLCKFHLSHLETDGFFFNKNVLCNMLKYFNERNWVPEEDPEWLAL